MRVLRVVAVVVAGLLGLLIVALIAVLLFVDPNKYRGQIEQAARQHTDRELTIGGKLQLRFFPWLALSVGDARLSNRPGFGTEPFLTVRNASIGVAVLPLLGGRLEVSRIRLEGVSLNLVSRGAQNNWQDLSESDESEQTQTAAKPVGPAPSKGAEGAEASRKPGTRGHLSVEGMDLSRFSVVYRDEVKKTTTEISNAELHMAALDVGSQRVAMGKLELEGTYLARGVASPASAEAGHSPEEPKPLSFALRTSALTLDGATEILSPAKAELKVGDSALTISVSGEKMSSDPQVSGTVTIPNTSARKLLQSLGIAPPVTRDPQALATVGLQTNFRLTRREIELSALQVTLDDTRIQGGAAVEDLDHPAIRFDLSLNAINLDRYRGPERKVAAQRSPTPVQPPTPLPIESLRKLNVHGSVRAGSATVSNLLFKDLVVPLVAQDGHIRLGPTQAHLYGGSCDGEIVLDAGPPQAELSLNEHVHGTDIGALMKAAFDSARLSGRADVDVLLKGSGNTDDALLRSLNGKIDANVKQGALIGIDVPFELQRANALLKRQIPPQRTGPARTVFNALQANGTLDKGILHIDELRVETDFLKVHGGGTLDTVTEAINYQLVASVNKSQPNGGPANEAGGGLDALKSVDVPLSITGTLSRPAVRPDIEALARGKLGQEVKQQAVEQVKKKLGDKLKDLLGR